MTRILFLRVFTLFLCAISQAQINELSHLASYQTNSEDAAETVTYDPNTQRVFFTSSSDNSLTIIDISIPTAPVLVKKIDLSTYGAGPNSVDTNGTYVAVAIEASPATDPGIVVFFDLEGNYITRVTVGSLPDMITFTPDGSKLLVANEGEPSDDYTIDPEGSVSIIEVVMDQTLPQISSPALSITFEGFNDKKASLQNKGVRIFGNNGIATVAQDLEPEFITVTPDGSKAYVNCQENNALVVISLANNSILDILPLGFKNHLLGTPTVEQYAINELVTNWPALGIPVYDGGQPEVLLGGFSGLFFDENSSTESEWVFYAVPDRGPNADSVSKSDVTPVSPQNLRPFKLPDYQGRIVKFTLDKTTGTITLDDPILLHQKDGMTPITGKGNIPGFDEVPVTYSDDTTDFSNEDYMDTDGETYHVLPYDAYGGDFEGVLADKNGFFWMCDEYRPAIYKFEPNGTLVERYVPEGTSLLGTTAKPVGTYGAETLPAVYSKRRANRGFEAIAYDKETDIIYAFIQSPLYNPSNSTRNNSDVIRILGINGSDGIPVAEYVYLLERNKNDGYATSRVDKIGDAVYAGNGKFLVIERDSEDPAVREGKKYIFEIDINYATNLLSQTFKMNKELEEMTADEIVSNGIIPVHKIKMVNLPSLGYQSSDKPEGIALLPDNQIAVLNDNDFGLAGAGVTDKSVLGIISFANDYGFDASNRDDKIDIKAHPTLGMYMPDAIASYNVNGVNYMVTANEGDARDYDGYSEEVRVRDLALNPAYYPNATTIQEEANLGRLKTTTATGDYDGNGTIEQIYSYGARSFSIFDEYGNLVYDSADALGQITALEEPALFNEDEGAYDGRSDDKGVEPEAIAIGTIDDRTFAFIGLERQSSILVYDITNPRDVEFITYYKGNRKTGDIAPEILKFVKSQDSPNGKNLLVVGYEVSGSVGLLQIEDEILDISEEVNNNTFTIYPNPIRENQSIYFNKPITGSIFNTQGQLVRTFENTTSLKIQNMSVGVYIIKTKENGIKRFLKL